MEGRPITVFIVTALTLWAVYLWHNGRLGVSGVLPHPADAPKLIGPPVPFIGPRLPGVSAPPGWQSGATPPGQQDRVTQ
jgi:hypothetical protein